MEQETDCCKAEAVLKRVFAYGGSFHSPLFSLGIFFEKMVGFHREKQ